MTTREVSIMATNNNETKVVKLKSFVSKELLKKMKEKEPDTKFILPNGKEAVLNAKEQPNK